MKRQLVIIDPQNDFCDPNGSLFVPGADEDMNRLAAFIDKFGNNLNSINVTLDSHHYIDIAHPPFWKDSSGNHPNPFTVITSDDLKNGRWQPAHPSSQIRQIAKDYVESLEANNRYALCIWPIHCVIGTWGTAIYPALEASLRKWCTDGFRTLGLFTKGSNPYTEHYSAVQAEVPDPNDISTQINTAFLQSMMDNDEIIISGEALSHCVANTFRDAADQFQNDALVEKLVLLEDTCSNVTTFEQLGKDFISDLKARGMRVTTTTQYTLGGTAVSV